MIILFHKTAHPLKRLERQPFFTHQNIDSLVSVVNISSAFIPITEFPLLLRRGLHTATAYLCG